LYARYAVLSKEQCAEAWLKREISELSNVVVGEIYGVVVLLCALADSQGAVLIARQLLTLAAPMFSIAEILWPKNYKY